MQPVRWQLSNQNILGLQFNRRRVASHNHFPHITPVVTMALIGFSVLGNIFLIFANGRERRSRMMRCTIGWKGVNATIRAASVRTSGFRGVRRFEKGVTRNVSKFYSVSGVFDEASMDQIFGVVRDRFWDLFRHETYYSNKFAHWLLLMTIQNNGSIS